VISRARLAKLEARHNPQRGCLTVHEVPGSAPVAFVVGEDKPDARRWTQRDGESVAALLDRIVGDAQVATLIVCTDRDLPGATVVRRTYGRGARIVIPDNGRDL
jgi:hypothetical protein